MYEKVENKVIFGDFESDWFDQEFGLKQECVLSPTLFSILISAFSLRKLFTWKLDFKDLLMK
jgi:hypothetical protein